MVHPLAVTPAGTPVPGVLRVLVVADDAPRRGQLGRLCRELVASARCAETGDLHGAWFALNGDGADLLVVDEALLDDTHGTAWMASLRRLAAGRRIALVAADPDLARPRLQAALDAALAAVAARTAD